MASYDIEWKPSAEKELRRIHTDFVPRIVQVVESLGDDPFPVGHRKLVGGSGSYRVRVGDYRIVYQVDAQRRVVEIYHVRHRKDAYR